MRYQNISFDQVEPANTLTEERLQKLTSLAKSIEEPLVYGKFNSEEHYLKTLELVLASTDETRSCINFIKSKILSSLESRNSILDIGPGDGSLTKDIICQFNHITAIDPNIYALNKLENLIPKAINYNKILNCVTKTELKENYYDLAILSHILYYISDESWLYTIKKIYSSLKKNGIIVIILGGDSLDKAKLIRKFNGKSIEIDRLAANCMQTFGRNQISLYSSTEHFKTPSKQAMMLVLGFLLYDVKITSTKKELLDYIDLYVQYFGNTYMLRTEQKYIVIKKNTSVNTDIDKEQGIEAPFSRKREKGWG